MIESLSLADEKTIKDIRNLCGLNLFRLKKTNYATIKNIRNLYGLKKKQ